MKTSEALDSLISLAEDECVRQEAMIVVRQFVERWRNVIDVLGETQPADMVDALLTVLRGEGR